jgi:hypothetical protein
MAEYDRAMVWGNNEQKNPPRKLGIGSGTEKSD